MPTAATKRRSRPLAAPTREVILDTAERLFAVRGVEGVAVRDLAREMGIAASSLYDHFHGKQALYEAVLERELAPIIETVAVAWRDGLRPDRVHVTLDALTRHLVRRPHLARLLQRAWKSVHGPRTRLHRRRPPRPSREYLAGAVKHAFRTFPLEVERWQHHYGGI